MKKDKILLCITAAVIVLAGTGAYALHAHLSGAKKYATSGDASQKGTSQKTTSVAPPDGTSGSGTSEGKPGTSVTVTPVPAPADNAPYPIENEHYKIDQLDPTVFDVTLYAIINSPSQHDEYIAQLKQYKQEALSYLTSRYGNLSQFTINWDPPEAKSL